MHRRTVGMRVYLAVRFLCPGVCVLTEVCVRVLPMYDRFVDHIMYVYFFKNK